MSTHVITLWTLENIYIRQEDKEARNTLSQRNRNYHKLLREIVSQSD